jgi:hypothetical protein
MTASPVSRSMCRGAEMEVNTQTKVLYMVAVACVTVDAIAAFLERPRHKITSALTRLIARGLVDRREEGCFAASEAGAIIVAHGAAVSNGAPDTRAAARRPMRGTLRQRAWNVMRIQRIFTIRGLAMVASRGNGDPEKNLQKWFLGLERAGYLDRMPQREATGVPGSNGLVRYRLKRDTGPASPVLSETHGCIRDPNTGEDMPCGKRV